MTISAQAKVVLEVNTAKPSHAMAVLHHPEQLLSHLHVPHANDGHQQILRLVRTACPQASSPSSAFLGHAPIARGLERLRLSSESGASLS